MLKHRIIPIILIDGFSVLKTIKFETRRNIGSPITVMRTFETRNVDEMIILDIDATKQNRSFDHGLAQDISSDCFMPLTFGGGVKSCTEIEQLLKAGADKVSLNTSALADEDFIREAVAVFGSQCIVISLDIENEVLIRNLQLNSGSVPSVRDFILRMEDCDIGEFLITDVDSEGLMSGPNLNLAKHLASLTTKPVIFAGGVAKPTDCADLIEKSGVDAVGCSSIFYFSGYTPNDCRQALIDRNLPARLT
jgi:cyclase